ncbi:MAG: MFS transporter [Gammaproteobacteria bacterium]|nr:MFS transporter [Gammaproteobacteria bacterium]
MPTYQRDRGYAWVVAIASLLLMAMGTGGTYVVVVALKPIAAEFGWPRSVPSSAYALAMMGMGIGGILMGKWADRRGVAPPVLLGSIAVALGGLLGTQIDSQWALLAVNGVLLGLLGNAALFAPLVANVTRWFDRRRGLAVAIASAGQSLGGAAWPPIHRYVIEHHGWREAYLLYGIVALVVMMPLVYLVRVRPPEDPVVRSPGPAPSAASIRAGRALLWRPNSVQAMLCVAIVGCCIAMSMPMVHIVAYGSDLGFSPARAAELLSVLLGFAIVSRIVWGLISDRIGGLQTLLFSSACQALMLSMFLFADTLTALYLTAAFYGLAYGGIVPTYAVIIREHLPLDQSGWRMGLVFLFGTVGMSLGGLLGGFIYDLTGSYRDGFTIGVAFNVANLIVVAPMVLRERWMFRTVRNA